MTISAAQQKCADDLRKVEALYKEQCAKWETLCKSRAIDANLPDTLAHHLAVNGIFLARGTKIVPVFGNAPPWANEGDITNYVEWMQDEPARLLWFNENPDAAVPTGFTITFNVEQS